MSIPRLVMASVSLACLPAAAMAQAPAITHALPAAVAPRQPADVTFFGAGLNGATGLWMSFPGTAELSASVDKNGTDPAKVVYRLNVPGECPVGIGGVRVATGQGISSLRLFMIDDLPSIAENGDNKTVAKAQELNLPVAVDGACEAESYDFYKFAGLKGQRVSVEVVARRLGFALDPVVRLLDAKGRELAFSDDEPGLGADSRFARSLPADGAYILELRDIQYGGGAGHRYRLRVGDFPLVTATFPLGVQHGATVKLQALGPAVDGQASLEVAAPATPAVGQVAASAKLPGGRGSAMLRVVIDDLPEAIETEPNNKREEATAVAMPAGINGRFAANKDRDFYKFEAKKGERWVFAGQTRELGSPTDLFLRIYNAEGASLAEAEDSGVDEGSLNFTFPADGTYCLMAEDLLRRGGPEHAYRINCEKYQPGFSLALEADKFDAPRGGVFVAKVTAARRDYNGPITLAVAGCGDGFTLEGNVIPEGKPETQLRVTLPERLAPGQLANFKITGTAKIGDKDFTAEAKSLAALQRQFNGLTNPPQELLANLGMGVGPVFPEFFKLTLEPPAVLLPQVVSANTFKVKAERLNKFDEAIALAVEGLPEGVTAEVKPVEKGKPEAVVTLKGKEGLAEGEHKFRLVGKASFQNQPKTVTLADVTLKIVKPLAVSGVPAGPLSPGGKQKLKITAVRVGDHKSAVKLGLRNLPAGVTAPETLALAEGQNEVEIELAAAGDAAASKSDNVIVSASTKLNDKDVTVESAPMVVEIVK